MNTKRRKQSVILKQALLILFLLATIAATKAQQNNDYFSVAAPTKMNVLYIGVDNPLDIIIEGVSCENTDVKITNGTITKDSAFHYTARPEKPGKCTVTLLYLKRGRWKEAGSKEFRVKRIPDPKPYLAGVGYGEFVHKALWSQSGLGATPENFDFDLKFEVVEYTFVRIIDGYSKEIKVTGNRFPPEIIKEINDCKQGEKVIFTDIMVSCPDGSVRNIGEISYRIE